MPSHCKISVILPNYNHGRFLVQRVNSILNQTEKNIELIVLDDHSSDNSIEVLQQWKDHPLISHIVVNKENSGSAFKQWKKGIELAVGEWVWIAESDDFSDLSFLEMVMKFSEKNEDCGLIYCQSNSVDENGITIESMKKFTDSISTELWGSDFAMNGYEFLDRALKIKNVIPNASAVVFRRSLMTSDCFDDQLMNMRMAGDWLMWIRLAQKTSVGFVAAPLNSFRKHGNATRIHNSVDKRKNRIWEEKIIRDELTTRFPNLNQENEKSALHEKWFDFHSLRFLLYGFFWRFKLKGCSSFKFATHFIKYNRKYR